MLALAFGTVCCVRLVGGSWTIACAVLALVAWTFEPLRADVRVGNTNQIQLALLALYLLFCKYGRRFPLEELAGFTLGLSVIMKPNIVGVAVAMFGTFFVDRRFDRLRRQGAGFIVAGIVCVGISIFFFGTASVWTTWLLNLALVINRMSLDLGNLGLSRLIRETAGPTWVWLLLTIVPIVFGTAIWRSRQPRSTLSVTVDSRQFDRDYLVASLAVAATLLCSSVAWLHYYLLLIPLSIGATPLVVDALLKSAPGSLSLRGCHWYCFAVGRTRALSRTVSQFNERLSAPFQRPCYLHAEWLRFSSQRLKMVPIDLPLLSHRSVRWTARDR